MRVCRNHIRCAFVLFTISYLVLAITGKSSTSACAQQRMLAPPGLDTSANTPLGPPPELRDEQENAERHTLRINTTLVTIPVSVMDRNGKYVPKLQQRDFLMYEDGVEQEIAFFAPVETPITVALLLDTSGSTFLRLKDIQAAAIAFVNQLRDV